MGRKTRQKQLRVEARKLELQKRSQKTNFPVKIPKNILIIISFLAVLLSIAYLALIVFKPGVPSGHDIIAHTFRAKIFVEAIKAGQFPVRWVDWIVNNFSGPLFNFYQVGFYYFVFFANQIIPSLYESIKAVVLFSWWLGALFMFLYARRFGNLPGVLAALIFTFTPYIISNYFVRAAYPESLAIAFSIGVLWSLDRILISSRLIYSLPLSLTLAGALITHLPTVVIIFPILMAYACLLLLNKEVKLKGFMHAVIASLIGVGFSAFYLFPSLFELNLIKSTLLTSSYYDFHPHFVYPEQLFSLFWGYGISQAGPQDGMSFQVGVVQWLIIIISLIALIYQKVKKNGALTLHIVFWLLALLYSLFFIHEISLSFWENIRTISFIQYPWRYLMIIAFATPILSALLLNTLKKYWQQTTVIFITIISIFLFYNSYLHPAQYLEDKYFRINDPDKWQTSEAAPITYLEEGYLPATAEMLANGKLEKWILEKGQGKVEEKTILNHYKSLVTTNNETLVLTLTTHYFPGWKAYIDGQETEIETTENYGFMRIIIPSGLHRVEFKFTDTLIRSFANLLSILSVIIFALWHTWENKEVFKKYLLINKTHS